MLDVQSPMPLIPMCSLDKKPYFHQVSQLTTGSNMRTTEWIGRLIATTQDTQPLIFMGTIVLWLTIVCSRKHTISYIQKASHKWIEGDEEETTYAQATKSLRVVPINIQHRLEVLQRLKVAHEPLVKALSSFENMESHGELIKPILRQLITQTSPKEGITLIELFGAIGTSLKALLQSRMMVQRYFYIDIDPIVRQVVAFKMMELIARFPQQFATTA